MKNIFLSNLLIYVYKYDILIDKNMISFNKIKHSKSAILILLVLNIKYILTVDKSNFKTCSQSGFCK